MNQSLKLKTALFVSLFSLFFALSVKANDSVGSNDYRERFGKAPPSDRRDPVEEGKGDGKGGGSKGGKFGKKKKKKKDDFRRVVGGSRDPVVPVTGVETGDLTAVTYKSPTPSAPLLEKAWNSTAWAPTYQPAGRSLLGEKGDLSSVIQSDLIKHTGWQVDGDSISVSPDLNGGPYDVQTGQAIAFAADHEGGTSVDLLGILGIPRQVASALTWDNPFSVFGPNNPLLLARKNPLKNPYGIVQGGRRLLNKAGVLSAWVFGEGGVQITEDGGIGIIHDPSGGEVFLAGLGIALWFTPVKLGPMLSAGTRMLPGASRALGVAAALGRGAWGRVSGLSQRAWGQVASTANQLGHWAVGAAGSLGRNVWRGMEAFAREAHLAGSGAGPIVFLEALGRAVRATGRYSRPEQVVTHLNGLYLQTYRRAWDQAAELRRVIGRWLTPGDRIAIEKLEDGKFLVHFVKQRGSSVESIPYTYKDGFKVGDLVRAQLPSREIAGTKTPLDKFFEGRDYRGVIDVTHSFADDFVRVLTAVAPHRWSGGINPAREYLDFFIRTNVLDSSILSVTWKMVF